MPKNMCHPRSGLMNPNPFQCWPSSGPSHHSRDHHHHHHHHDQQGHCVRYHHHGHLLIVSLLIISINDINSRNRSVLSRRFIWFSRSVDKAALAPCKESVCLASPSLFCSAVLLLLRLALSPSVTLKVSFHHA